MPDKREEEIKEVVFGKKELDPEEQAAYVAKIAEAKKKGLNAFKGKTPLGHVERPAMPDLTQPSGNVAEMPAGLVDGGVQPRPPGSPLLSPQTAAGLQQVLTAQQQAPSAPKGTVAEERAAMKAEEERAMKDLFEEFNFERLTEAEKILNNKQRRDEIGARCSQMKFEDMLLFDEVKQTVPIRKDGKFTVVFRSLRPEESLFLKEYLSKKAPPNEAYAIEKLALMQLACSLVKINDQEWPSHLDKNGDPKEDLFEAKLRKLSKKSGYVVADLSINYGWFDLRCRRLMLDEGALGNG
jgi:hypothetical protein